MLGMLEQKASIKTLILFATDSVSAEREGGILARRREAQEDRCIYNGGGEMATSGLGALFFFPS